MHDEREEQKEVNMTLHNNRIVEQNAKWYAYKNCDFKANR